jgi:hypothetical protein
LGCRSLRFWCRFFTQCREVLWNQQYIRSNDTNQQREESDIPSSAVVVVVVVGACGTVAQAFFAGAEALRITKNTSKVDQYEQ